MVAPITFIRGQFSAFLKIEFVERVGEESKKSFSILSRIEDTEG